MIVANKYRDIREMQHFLQGGVLGGRAIQTGQTHGFLPIVGQTLIFSTPVATCTFTAGANPQGLTAPEIVAQIEAAVPTVRAFWLNGCLALILATPASPAIVVNKTGTSNGFFGFSNGVSGSVTPGKFVNNFGGAAPAYLTSYPTPDNSHVVLTWE